MIDNLSVIDYAKCTNCGICVQKCPQASIISVSGKFESVKAKENAKAKEAVEA